MRVNQYQLAAGTSYKTAYYIARSDRKGPACLITAGIHGNEIAGMRAAGNIAQSLMRHSLALQRGTLIIVPIVNRQASRKRIRGVPDINRTFPRHPKDRARHPLSAALVRLAKKHRPEWVLDLHEANGFSRVDPKVLGQSLITNSRNASLPVVRRIAKRMNRSIKRSSRQFTVRLRSLPGSSRTGAARLLRAKAVTVETSWNLPLSLRVQFQETIVRHFLREAGLIS